VSHLETNQPLTELCERAWKLLYRHGDKQVNTRLDATIYFRFEDYYLYSENRFLWVSKIDDAGYKRPIFTVDEEGIIGALAVVECAVALERFRQYTILDDLAEV